MLKKYHSFALSTEQKDPFFSRYPPSHYRDLLRFRRTATAASGTRHSRSRVWARTSCCMWQLDCFLDELCGEYYLPVLMSTSSSFRNGGHLGSSPTCTAVVRCLLRLILVFAGAVFWHLSRFRTLNRRSLSTVKAATKVDESLMGIHFDNLDYWWAYCLVKDRTVLRYLVNDRSLWDRAKFKDLKAWLDDFMEDSFYTRGPSMSMYFKQQVTELAWYFMEKRRQHCTTLTLRYVPRETLWSTSSMVLRVVSFALPVRIQLVREVLVYFNQSEADDRRLKANFKWSVITYI